METKEKKIGGGSYHLVTDKYRIANVCIEMAL
jgi:hypothetical protein